MRHTRPSRSRRALRRGPMRPTPATAPSNGHCWLLMTACVAALCQAALAQTPPGAVLKIDLKDFVPYQIDVRDYANLATDPGIVMTAAPARPFASFSSIADIVAVNGRPAKGTFVDRANWVRLRPDAQPGQAIADTTRSVMVEWHCEILLED